MNDAPRPLNLGEIFDRTIHHYRSRFWLFFGISVIPTGVILVIASAVFLFLAWWGNSGLASASKETVGAIAVLFVGAVAVVALPLMLAAAALAEAALNHAANRAWYDEPTTIRAAYKAAWPRGWRYIGLYFLRSLGVWAFPVAVWFGIFALAMAVQISGFDGAAAIVGFLTVLSVVGCVGFSIWMALRLSLAMPASIAEQTTAWASLKRSVALSKGTRGRIFLLYLLVVVLNGVVWSGVLILSSVVIALVPGASSPERQQMVGIIVMFISYGANFAVQALTKPVCGIALMLFYYDQRIRQEGFDIEWMMQQAGMMPPPVPDAPVGVSALGPSPMPVLLPAYELPILSSSPAASQAAAASYAAQVAPAEPPPLPWETTAASAAPVLPPDAPPDPHSNPLPLHSIGAESTGEYRGEAI